MKKLVIFALILMAGITAYPQATRSGREKAKSEKSSTKKESEKRTVNRSSDKKEKAERKATTSTENKQTRSDSKAVRSGNDEKRSTSTTRSDTRSRVETSNDDQRKVRTNNDQRKETGSAERRQQTTTNRSDKRTDNGATQSRTIRESDRSNDKNVKVNSTSASRTYREGRGTLTRDDGTVVRHQNDEVFASRKYRLDYDNYENLRRSDEFRNDYTEYHNWYTHRYIRDNRYHNHYNPISFDLRRERYYHRHPVHIDLIWTPLLFHRFMYYYPTHDTWEMEFGTPIETISAYEAQEYVGTVRRVYGKVDEVYYSPEDDNYLLYIGAPFPYQDISVVIPKHIAREITRSPKWYFEDEYIWVVGLINTWEGKPEIIVRDEEQIRKY